MLKAVFDTTTLVSAFLTKKGVSALLLQQAVAGALELHLSEAILAETQDVLLNREHLRRNFIYTDHDVEEFCLLLKAFARLAADLPALQVSRDPEDDYVIATALAAGVSYLVTRDKDLLTLKTYQEVQIVRPEEFITLVRQHTSHQ
ncbi:MAG: putative toxin-antitoxin system toxin component, PIN family, partial [Candidatus Binatia bacterium]